LQHRLALGLEEARELRDGRRLARPVHAGEQDHEGLRQGGRGGFLERGQQRHQRLLQFALELGRVLEALVARGLAQCLHQVRGGGRADVRRKELRLELFVQGLVDLRARAQHVDRAFPARARELEVLLEECLEAGAEALRGGVVLGCGRGRVLLAEEGRHGPGSCGEAEHFTL
jgi:hypothetical protein